MLLGLVLMAFAGVFVVAISLVLLFGSRAIPRVSLVMAPGPILLVFGVGVGLLRSGLGDWRRAARGKELSALHPDQPWFADWHWDPAGAHAESAWSGGGGVFVMMFILLVMAPFNVLWLHVFDPHEDPTARALSLMVLIPDFFMFLLLKAVVSIGRDRIRFGRPHLGFDAFPFFLGESLHARLTAKAFADREGVVASLRCIDERMVSVPSSGGGLPTDTVEPFQIYEARQPFPGRFEGVDVILTFALPREGRPTQLLKQPPLYWELEVECGGDSIRFVVPVYSRPAG